MRTPTILLAACLASLALAAAPAPSPGQCMPDGACYRPVHGYPAPGYFYRPAPVPAAQGYTPLAPGYAPRARSAPAGDPAGFVAWLNGQRAARGLGPVAWDADLAGWAAANSARGFGHFTMGPARRQNAGMGDLGRVCSMWLASPAHASALFDPSITRVAVAGVGSVWTYDAN